MTDLELLELYDRWQNFLLAVAMWKYFDLPNKKDFDISDYFNKLKEKV